MRDEPIDEGTALLFRHAENASCMGSEVERLAPGFANSAHHRLWDGRHLPAFVVAKVGKAKPSARVEDRMLGDKRLQPPLHFFGQRIVSCALVSEFGVAANRRNRTRIKQRRARRHPFERVIRMPESSAQLEKASPAFFSPDLAGRIQIRYVGKFSRKT